MLPDGFKVFLIEEAQVFQIEVASQQPEHQPDEATSPPAWWPLQTGYEAEPYVYLGLYFSSYIFSFMSEFQEELLYVGVWGIYIRLRYCFRKREAHLRKKFRESPLLKMFVILEEQPSFGALFLSGNLSTYDTWHSLSHLEKLENTR